MAARRQDAHELIQELLTCACEGFKSGPEERQYPIVSGLPAPRETFVQRIGFGRSQPHELAL